MNPISRLLASLKGSAPLPTPPPATVPEAAQGEGKEHLALYWRKDMADLLETWGERNAWHEIDYLIAPLKGKVLDIACGTGRTITQFQPFKDVEAHGCDISDVLIKKAIEKSIPEDRLTVCDAVNMPYADNFFDYSFSIGSLEHFRNENCEAFIREAGRVTRVGSFHQIPTSRDGTEHGWIKTFQSYYNNPVEWWLPRFERVFRKVIVLRSLWEDERSIGRWFLCYK